MRVAKTSGIDSIETYFHRLSTLHLKSEVLKNNSHVYTNQDMIAVAFKNDLSPITHTRSQCSKIMKVLFTYIICTYMCA
jgi:hypothetical protein